MPDQTYQKSQIATQQLRTAVFLFLSGGSRASVITLAGASSGILEHLVRIEDNLPFVDYARSFIPGPTFPRDKYRRYVNELLGINALKHMSPNCLETLEIDLEESAIGAVTKAMADHVRFYGYEHDFIKAFLQWAWLNCDGPKIMQEYRRLSKG
jgi:hypothetical protein